MLPLWGRRPGPWVEVVPIVYTVNTHFSFSCLGDSKAVTLLVRHHSKWKDSVNTPDVCIEP